MPLHVCTCIQIHGCVFVCVFESGSGVTENVGWIMDKNDTISLRGNFFMAFSIFYESLRDKSCNRQYQSFSLQDYSIHRESAPAVTATEWFAS